MEAKTLGFIGGGRITGIFLQAFKNRNMKFKQIVVFDTNSDVSGKLKQKFPETEISTLEEAASQDYIFIALHPPVIMETLDRMSNVVTDKSVVISLAPKIKMDVIAGKLKTNRIARLIPNATSVINKGFNPVSFISGMPQSEKVDIINLLSDLGEIFEVPENKLEPYAIVSAMAPTYFWFQWKTLSEIGINIGMDKEEAETAVYKTMIAALDTFYKSGMAPENVFDLIPVKPIADNENQIKEFYMTKLNGLYDKIK